MTEREATGQEPWTPVRISAVSATERASFRRCRRQWLLTVVHRLQEPGGNVNFWLGTLVHVGLEAYYRELMEGLPVESAETGCLDAYQHAYDASLDGLRADLGFLWPTAEPMYREIGEMGLAMLEGYLENERRDPVGEEVVQVERRVFVPIRSEGGRRIGALAVQTDLVVRRRGRLAVVDHKTAAQAMSDAQLDLDDQLTAEVYAVWLDSGEMPSEAVYNTLLKRVPEPPKLLKSGKLSVDRQAPTTYDLYVAEVDRLGLSRNDYAEHLAWLAAEGSSRFFRREAVFRNAAQMASFEQNLREEFRDMRAVALHPGRAYPSPSAFACPGCPVRAVCQAMMDGGDASALIQENLVVGEPRY